MDLAVRATPARWWYSHKENIASWDDVKRLMAIRFSIDTDYVQQKYTRESNPRSHIQACEQDWSDILEDEWVHRFIHTLDTVPRNWYTEIELRKGTTTWPLMIDSFLLTFTFESKYPNVDQALDIIKTKILEDCTPSVQTQSEWSVQLTEALECYNFQVEPEDEDEDPRSTNILESEGTHDVEGPQLEIPEISEPIILILAHDLGTKNQNHQRIINKYS